ncbi:hypothetical protein N3K66_009012 [Trichothecium roseum]|uniref:Uncharacterized protein n=1 Tax=Trichothecium roseum TaxID=47278 RepID=A0ACC0URH0_9HYPO|nr:hypothetical protein N3K66_009012 [Trichothecium roseum]
METLDPATGQPLPADAIQRILFIANTTHVYNIPPLSSTKGHSATSWTADPARHIFTARLRVVETSLPSPTAETNGQGLKVDVVLEDGKTGALFAAAPYAAASAVEAAVDSSRFFALTVRDPNGRKAVLGIGFEDRSEAFDLNLALQEARKALGWEGSASSGQGAGAGVGGVGGRAGGKAEEVESKDYSLKEGETITVNLGGKVGGGPGGKRSSQIVERDARAAEEGEAVNLQSFALAPPPGSSSPGVGSGQAAPLSAQEARKQKRLSARDLGFDDGQFGEFA